MGGEKMVLRSQRGVCFSLRYRDEYRDRDYRRRSRSRSRDRSDGEKHRGRDKDRHWSPDYRKERRRSKQIQ